ncbi:flagellar FliJ family protein [Shigella boydii]
MAEHGALATLKDSGRKRGRGCRGLLVKMRRGCQQAEEQLKMLIDYQNEYRNNLNSDMSAGMTRTAGSTISSLSRRWKKPLRQHRQQLNQWTQKVDIALNSWRERKQRLQACRHCRNGNRRPALLAENRPH